MGIGDIRAAVTVVLSIRDDWAEHRRAVAGQIEALAGDYDHPDVLYVAVVVARNPDNRSPTMLTTLAANILAKLHAKQASNPTRGPRTNDDGYLCDVCTKPESQCQNAATNLDGSDHAFVSIRRAEAERGRERATKNPETEANKRAVRDGFKRWGAVIQAQTAELAEIHHPEPEQEEAAS